MAMIKVLFAASVLASIASAVPMQNKRAAETHTVTHTAWETIDVTTTVYVNDADPTPPPQAAAVNQTIINQTTTPVPAAGPAAVPSPANFQQEQANPVAASPSVQSPPTVASPTPAAPTADTSNQARAGVCEGSGSACSGDITYYNGAGGYGACGSLIDDSNPNVALPHGLMGTQSNGNPYCGRTVSIKGTDGSIHTGTVVDKCMGCEGYSIDLSPGLFSAVAPAGNGRVSGIEWWFS